MSTLDPIGDEPGSGRPDVPADVPLTLEQVVGRRLRAEPAVFPSRRTAEPLSIEPEQLRLLLADALTAKTGSVVVWVDRDGSELLAALSDVQVAVLDGVVAIGLPVRCDQAGVGDLTTVVTVGMEAGQPAPLLLVEQQSRNDGALAARWGAAAAAAVVDGLSGVLRRVAAAAGTDAAGHPMRPTAVWAIDGRLLMASRAPFPAEVDPP
jgi:hypothetical protein